MWQANTNVLVTDLEDELVVLDPQSSQMFSLNAAGRLIWQHLPATTQTLSEVLAQTYGLESQRAQDDVQAVLEQLLARQLVQHT